MGLGPGDAGRTDRDLSQWNYHARLMYRNQLCLTTLIMVTVTAELGQYLPGVSAALGQYLPGVSVALALTQNSDSTSDSTSPASVRHWQPLRLAGSAACY
jgi:hypothetical protein